MRLFIALDFEEISDYLKTLQQQIPKVKSTFPKEFHLTLKFLGDVEENKLDEIKEKLSRVKVGQITAELAGIGVFPNDNFIRVVWAGVKDPKPLTKLQKQIEKSLSPMFEKDERFHPHITLARIKYIDADYKQLFAEKVKSISVEPKQITLTSFKLIKSTLTGNGPEYEVLEEYN